MTADIVNYTSSCELVRPDSDSFVIRCSFVFFVQIGRFRLFPDDQLANKLQAVNVTYSIQTNGSPFVDTMHCVDPCRLRKEATFELDRPTHGGGTERCLPFDLGDD